MAANVMFLQEISQLSRHLRCRAQLFHKKAISCHQEQQFRLCSSFKQQDNEGDDDKKRNISRLSKHMQRRLRHDPPTEEDLGWHPHWTRPSFRRGLYATYGSKSGVPAGVMWPTKDELKEIKADEEEWEPTLQEMISKLKTQREEERAARLEKEQYVDKQLAKMPQYIADLQGKHNKVLEAEQRQEEKRKALMEEARDFFGYSIDTRDPRFKQMQELKEEEEKKMKKKMKKDAKLQKQVSFKASVKTPAASDSSSQTSN